MSLFNELLEPMSIGDNLTVDVLLSHRINYDSEVTRFPVETGFEISDHIIRKQPQFECEVLFTPTSVTWFELHKDEIETRLNDVKAELKKIRDEGIPLTVKTYDEIYENMVLVSIPIEREKNVGLAYKMKLTFVQVAVVKSNTADVPAEYAEQEKKVQAQTEKTETNAGTAKTSDIGTGGSGSTSEEMTAGDTNMSYDTGAEETANTANQSWAKSIGSGLGLF